MNFTAPAVPLFWRIFWSALALGIVAGSIGWWSIMPHGFPLIHPRFWMNQLLPWVGIGMGSCLVVSAAVLQTRWFSTLVCAVPAVILGGAVTMRVLYPLSAQGVWYFGLVLGGLTWAAAWLAVRATRIGWINITVSVIAGASLGLFMLWSQRGDIPSTVPVQVQIPPVNVGKQASRLAIKIAPGVDVQPDIGRIKIHAGTLSLVIYPLISFESRSSDRFWVLFSPSQMLLAPDRWLEGSISGTNGTRLEYAGSERSVIHLPQNTESRNVEINAYTDINKPVYSHINTYTQVDVTGHRQLKVIFSPVQDKAIEVLPADYPTGRPARFAYLSADGVFRIVEASSGEKGPFREIGSGPLARGSPLSMVLLDNGRPMARIVFQDWSSQISTALSPSAGWGIPMNAIEFSRASADPESPVNIYSSLASTSIGRGFDSVGHASGIYMNRMRVERLWLADGIVRQ